MKINDKEAKQLAQLIAEELFTDGYERRAHRLILAREDNFPLAGWRFRPAKDQIEKVIHKFNSEPEQI